MMTDKTEIFEIHYQQYCDQIGAWDLEKAARILGMTEEGGTAVLPWQ